MRNHIKIAVEILLALAATVLLIVAFFCDLDHNISEMREDTPSDGVGRMYTANAERYAATTAQAEEGTALRVFCETDPDLPAWWDPESAEIVYQAPIARTTHRDALDYNLNSTLWGWDGHGMEVWEMELFSRIVYLEFWGTSDACVDAGIDSMLLLWDRGEYGRTMGELLSAQYAPGYYVYSPYAYVWNWTYDAEVLADIRALCEERFANGPEWCAPYFRLWYYHDWATPAYEIDGVFFSVPRG